MPFPSEIYIKLKSKPDILNNIVGNAYYRRSAFWLGGFVSGNSNVEDVRIESQAYYPVLLTCPHGGTVKASPASWKSNLSSSCDPDQFTKDRAQLTQSIALNLYRLGGRDVYTNIALVHSRFVDFKRDPECAFELSTDHLAEHLYNVYHNGIKKIIKKMYNQNNQGLRFLFDIRCTGGSECRHIFWN